ncbi:EAL domain-containing protein [Ancylothrix sp. C2]|uniref:sensor domain-containing protein n=1 Tax=Ancylothrix sp. D3o TaxID=2953691 RepID=UPI0021BB48E6|nr:bifunctional diguanylate cyclase/phosphodiesterase [Ancylothrix sp. D3o]MCT7949003.1 EAL domain-containing protein [Ancylothrix sp. D3o]
MTIIEGMPPAKERMNQGLLIVDNTGTIKYINRPLCQILGYTPEELLGRFVIEEKTADWWPTEKPVNPKKSDSVCDSGTLALATTALTLLETTENELDFLTSNSLTEAFEEEQTIKLRKKTGEIIDLQIEETRLLDEDTRLISIVIPAPAPSNFATPALLALKASEELHRITLAHITEAVFVTDDLGNFTFICPNVQAFFGYSPQEIKALGKISKLLGVNLFQPSELEKVGEIKNIERAIRDKSGKRRFVLINVKRVSILEGTVLYCCHDITERRKAEEALYQERERFRLLIESVKDYAIFTLDALGMVESWNAGAESITGYGRSEIIGQHYSCFYNPAEIQQETPWKALRKASLDGRLELEGWYVRRDGSQFWADVVITALRDKYGYLEGFSVVTRDFTERKRFSEQLWHAAYHDELTGLPNRALFTRLLGEAVERAKQQPDYQYAVLFLDLDRFKLINDSLGHSIGDRLLVALAQQLQTFLRDSDSVARLGGDEFAILLDNIADIEYANSVAEQIHSCLKSPFNLNGYEVYTTVSIGIAASSVRVDSTSLSFQAGEKAIIRLAELTSLPLDVSGAACPYDRPEDLLRDADTAMYRAKSLGRARHELFNGAMHAAAVGRLALETELRRAVEKIGAADERENAFLLYYQPIICLETGRLTGFEALLRWCHATRGFIAPTEFIPVAEDTGLIVPLGAWVLREACRQLRLWQQEYPQASDLTVNVNLSSKQLSAPNLVEYIDELLEETSLNAACLKLEITETMLMENSVMALEVLEEFKARSIKFAIDDFGTGYSSLSYLHKLPVSTLKIDRSFVCRLGTEDENSEIVQAIITLAKNLGVDVVAEGIETPEQLRELLRLKCRYAQGYFFAKPLCPEGALALITSMRQWDLNF